MRSDERPSVTPGSSDAEESPCPESITVSAQEKKMDFLCKLGALALLLCGGLRLGLTTKTPLPVMALSPGGSWIGFDKSMELAVHDINQQEDILADYELQLYINHTNPNEPAKPSSGNADYIIYSNFYDGPDRPMPFLLGSFYSEECAVLCRAVARFNVIQISYGAVSPSLSDRTECPTFYRTVQSATQQNVPRLRLLLKYNWDRVAIIRYSNVVFTSVMESLRDLLRVNNISIVANEMFEDTPSNHIAYLKERDARIIIGLFWDEQGRQVFCEAYKQGLYGARYVWILRGIGYFAPDWAIRPDPAISCTPEEMTLATEGVVITNWHFLPATQDTALTGRTPSNFLATYNEYAGEFSFGDAGSTAYDAVLTAAVVFNKSIERLQLVNKTLEDFTYDDEEMLQVFMEVIDDLYFVGVSGPVSFLTDGDRVGQFKIEQIRGGTAGTVGYFLSHEDRFEWIDEGIYFLNGEPPHDEIRRGDRLVTISTSGFVAICSLCGLGIALACGLLVFNVVMRKQRIIKLSSPNINNLIIMGSLMTYISVILNGLDRDKVGAENMDHVCRAQLWMLALGFTLSFGSMFSKTWRVHSIFMNKKLEKKAVKDYQLVTMVGVFITLESLYLGVWEIRPLVAVLNAYEAQATVEKDLMLIPVVQRCTRHGVTDISWLAGIYIFNGVQLVFGLFLAYETRNVTIPALNDSKNIGMSVYNVFILSCVGAIFSLLMDPLKTETIFLVTSLCVLVSTTTTLLIIFTPKIIDVIRHPGGSKVTTMPSVTQQSLCGPGPSTAKTISSPPAPKGNSTATAYPSLVSHR
ncbi:gamma-aminobutyric acid type B receptor subunit 1-like isoform X2 [Acanthaster planci]|uniref:Gamma-aminobutyric acid type B receptor subunit 2 n=1 Tax=Acanthaster planci TaxID=133434 RepID=A0A8B7ZAD5_ACAPL|nr:gamma-aminobutyric acid type B receptor subunit 1-like isoform X2 [Acanthaster planci]